ncbi:NUDIX hydrolase [Ancylobacter mangrovi]|uniref:NUDIX hydrolase n=2 Tax=Ancylobacter mangrovi TaxID=2972472 RepID=A0A9X2T2P8_9HYPH|nr:NUDIX hydrolase [Ancylobacter mangrovi]MCS0496415.1 NUDIX hydrolase [Ancylobacter mangrovi]
MAKVKQKNRRASDGRPLQQVGALPFRVDDQGRLQILLVSSRETHRAVIPKGWPMRNRKDWKSAQIEARQEAGIVGDISRKRIGQYLYWKRLDTHFALVKVSVFPLAVRRQLGDWPERHERERRWMTPEDAALLVDETDLGALITEFAQSQTWRKLLPSRPVRREGEQLSPAGA